MHNEENIYALDRDIIERYEKLHTPLISDTLDQMGHRDRVLDYHVQSIFSDPNLKVVGPAYPCQVKATDEYVEIDNLLRMVDSIPPGTVVTVAIDRENNCSLWGGLMSATSKQRQAVGAVVNGCVRDIKQIAELGFPVFATGHNMHDIRTRGEMVQFGCTIQFGDVTIHPGDLLIGDANGVVCVARELILPVLQACEAAILNEEKTRMALETGGNAVEVYAQYQQF